MSSRATRAAVGLVVFFATLPMQWTFIVETPLGPLKWFHLGALFLVVIAPPSASALRALRAAARPLTGAVLVLTVMLVATAFAYDSRTLLAPVQNFIYVVVAACVGAALLTALRDPGARRIAVWSGPAALVAFVLAFGRSLSSAGIGPTAVISGLVSGDPSVAVLRFFRAAFRSSSDTLDQVSLRHEIFASLVVAAYVSLICRPAGRSRTVVSVSLVGVAALTLLSLSRAVILAGLIPVVLAIVRGLMRSRVSLYVLGLVGVVIAVSPVVGPPVWTLLTERFADETASYDARLGALQGASEGLGERLFLGGGDFGLSTHTMLLDATSRGGLLAGLAALVVIAVFVRHLLRAAGAYLQSGDVAALAAFGAGALAFTRTFTSGGGLLHLVEWSGVAAMIVAEIVRRESPVAPEPEAEVPARGPGVTGWVSRST